MDQDKEKKVALTLIYLSIFFLVHFQSVKQNAAEKGKVRSL